MTNAEKYVLVPLRDCIANTWNYNVMDGDKFGKLVHGIASLMREDKEIPPIVVRRHLSMKGKYEIIDGFHRWKAFQELGIADIPVFILEVSDATARILTSTLNYNRGKPDPDKHAQYLQELSAQYDMTLDNLADLLPESREELKFLAETYNIAYKPIKPGSDGDGDVERKEQEEADDTFTTLEFQVSISQAKIIESELDRIGGMLRGGNIRGRALEYMAVNSAQTPMEELERRDQVRRDTPDIASLRKLKAKPISSIVEDEEEPPPKPEKKARGVRA